MLKTQDQLRLEIIYKVKSGQLDRIEAALALKVSARTLRRYLKGYGDKGVSFVKHGNFGRAPKNKTAFQFREKILNLVQDKYFDFNMCHLREILQEDHGLKLSYSTLRRWCWSVNLMKNAQKRRSKPRRARSRMSQEGYMLQLDGSHHCWFGGRFLCLMAAIDDATSEVFAKFYEGETTWACMDFLNEICQKKGVMKFVYTDRAGLYGGIKREHFSQVERALGELGAHVIYAQSPEGKGRVERLFKTLQDRLVAELRFHGISDIDAANKYLHEVYLPQKHNLKFMVQPQNPISGYRPLAPKLNLNEVFCVKHYRVVGKDHTVSINAEKWIIADKLDYSIARQKLEIKFDKYGAWQAYFAGKPIKLIKIHQAKRLAA